MGGKDKKIPSNRIYRAGAGSKYLMYYNASVNKVKQKILRNRRKLLEQAQETQVRSLDNPKDPRFREGSIHSQSGEIPAQHIFRVGPPGGISRRT